MPCSPLINYNFALAFLTCLMNPVSSAGKSLLRTVDAAGHGCAVRPATRNTSAAT